jgi:competence protein ComEA
VRHPGLYRLPSGSRVGDAVAAAGGYGPTVDASAVAARLNLAERLEDGGKILVPERGAPAGSAPPSPGAAAGLASPGGAPLDLNRASATELDTLPGIGPATAAKILASRQQQPFRSVDDLLTRKLVRQSVFEGLRSLVRVGG